MMNGPFLIAAAMCVVHPAFGFVRQQAGGVLQSSMRRRGSTVASFRLFQSSSSSASSSSSSSKISYVDQCVSRMATLQKLLSRCGAPGSSGCFKPNDLQPVLIPDKESSSCSTPELVSSLSGSPAEELANLHPYLFPIAKSRSTGNFICAYRNPAVEILDSSLSPSNNNNKSPVPAPHPWPIVETTLNGPGMRLLALNSEHLMRRIACEHDTENNNKESVIVAMYNNGLGKGRLSDPLLDAPYLPGSVAQLGYGVDKYVLLRVGPFPDLYQLMSRQHASKGDEQSCLIAAEAANAKLAGFASNFLFYAQMISGSGSGSVVLSSYNRDEEARDAARTCLRLPLPTIGLTMQDDFRQVAILGQIADPSDSISVCMSKLRTFYEKIRQAENAETQKPAPGEPAKTPEQVAIDAANYIIDDAVLSSGAAADTEELSWSSVRGPVAEKFRSIGCNDFAAFVELKSNI
jgi:hypothetical protein